MRPDDVRIGHTVKRRKPTERQARVHDDGVRRALDVMHYEVVQFFIDEAVEQVLDGEAVGHEFVGPERETRRHYNVEQSVNHQRRGFEHIDGGDRTSR